MELRAVALTVMEHRVQENIINLTVHEVESPSDRHYIQSYWDAKETWLDAETFTVFKDSTKVTAFDRHQKRCGAAIGCAAYPAVFCCTGMQRSICFAFHKDWMYCQLDGLYVGWMVRLIVSYWASRSLIVMATGAKCPRVAGAIPPGEGLGGCSSSRAAVGFGVWGA